MRRIRSWPEENLVVVLSITLSVLADQLEERQFHQSLLRDVVDVTAPNMLWSVYPESPPCAVEANMLGYSLAAKAHILRGLRFLAEPSELLLKQVFEW